MLPNSSDLASYGGVKVNYAPVENPQTDFDAPTLSQMIGDAASSTRTVPRGYVRLTLNATDGYIVLNSWDAVWKSVTTTVPVIHHAATGTYTITFPTVVSDEWDAAQQPPVLNNNTVNIMAIYGCDVEGSTLAFAQATISSANVITLYTFNSAGSANDLASTVVNVVFR